MKALVATSLALALSLTACFPNSAKHRTYAKLGEGTALAAGIGMLYFVNSGADCDQNRMPGDDTSSCRGNAKIVSTVGLGLILAGLSGFIATVSTTPDDKPEKANTLTPTPIPAADKAAPEEPAKAAAPAETAAKP